MDMILVSTNIWPPSWDQFIPSVIATLAGVFLPFLIQSLIEKGKKKAVGKELLHRIYDELDSVFKKLNDFKDNSLEQNPLKTMAWHEALNMGVITMLKPSVRKKLFEIYEMISVFNSWAAIKTNYYFDNYNNTANRFNQKLNKELNDLKYKLLNQDAGIQSARSIIKAYLKIKEN